MTGPRAQDMNGVAAEYADALGRPVKYVDVPFDQWGEELTRRGLPDHLYGHFLTMARLHANGRYDRLTQDVERITGQPAASVRDFVTRNRKMFEQQQQDGAG